MAKIVDGQIQIQANLGIHVDEETFRVCMSLIKMYAKERDINAMLVRFNDDFYLGYEVNGIKNESEISYCPLCYQEVKGRRD